MSKFRIFTVGFDLPGDEFEKLDFRSDQTLLDADIVLLEPTLGHYQTSGEYNGKPVLTEHSSFTTKEYLDHWRSEIVAAVKAGKLVIVYLVRPDECYRYTGEREFSGRGRSRVKTDFVTKISSYQAVPNLSSVSAKSGVQIKIDQDARYLSAYWREFSEYSIYEVVIEGNFNRLLLKSRTGDRIVGAALHTPSGALLFLPPLRYDQQKFVHYDSRSGKSRWTNDAKIFGKRLVQVLVALADSLKRSADLTPAPNWASESEFRLAAEGELEGAISRCTLEIRELQSKKASLEQRLSEAGNLRRLLFEQGRPLESAILEALGLFGFAAQPFSDGESEFDAVFISAEGRCLGEAEGKDKRAINIDKFGQLERNLQEDFARDDVTDYAKGVLFGNAYRLSPMRERSDFFSEKCKAAAKRVGVALIRTPDLFVPAKYIKENPDDAEYAKQCREAIFRAKGQIVTFPAPPLGDARAIAEASKGADKAKPNL